VPTFPDDAGFVPAWSIRGPSRFGRDVVGEATAAIGATSVRAAGVLRQWPVAGVALIAAAISSGAAMLARG
jgi:hypothetical protein